MSFTKIIGIVLAVIFLYYFFSSSTTEEDAGGEPPTVESEELLQEEETEEVAEVEEEPEPVPLPKVKTSTQPKVLPAPKSAQGPKAKYPNLDDSFIPFDEEGNRYIPQVIQAGKHLVYHGDVLIGDAKDLPRLMKNRVIKAGKSRKWPDSKIPYEIDDNIVQRDKVMEAIEYLNVFTNLKIVPREEEEDFVLITRGQTDCYSYAGRKGGMQEIFLVPQCGVREILHEWMHTIGFFHEQNREDRDQYLKVNWDNIEEANRVQFKKLPNDFIGLTGRPFDYSSIMLYSSYVFSMDPNEPALVSIDGEILPPSKNLLSDEDIARVNNAYPKVE